MLKEQSNLARPQRNHELSIPIYSPRTTYNNLLVNDEALLTDLTLNFDSFTINVIKSEIKARNGVLPLVDFFLILKDQLTNWQKDLPFREKKLMRVLTMLFDEIDLNGNGVLEWDEFTTYIIDKATVLDSMKSKNEEVKAYTPVRLKLSKKFESLLTKVIYLQDIDRIAFLEEGSDEIHFINHDSGAFNPKPLKVTPVKEEEPGRNNNNSKSKTNTKGTLLKHAEKSMVLDMIYVREKKSYFLLTSSDDCAIRTWKYTSSGFIKANSEEEGAIYFTQAQVCIAWDEINQILYSGQRDGAINIWDRKSDTIIGKLHQDGHTDLIMDIIPLPKLQLLATCSLDKTIILWNTITNKKVRVFKEHTRGVVSLAFNKSLILLISAGYDHQICVWNPYIDNAVFKINSHNFPLVGVKVIEGTNHFVSLDSSGNIKVWDFKKFNCIQTMSLETVEDKHKFHPQAFTFIPKPLKLVLAGRTLNFFEYDKNYNPNAADDSVAFSIRYRPSNNTIITPTGNKIKVWNALTGEIKKIFLDISDSEITTFTLDELKKRCLIGFSNGEAAVFNVINGAKVKVLSKHNSEVSHIIEAKDLGFIITASGMDGTIKIHTDKAINESELARVISIQEVALTAIVYQPLNKLLVTGTQNGIVAFWEAETGKFIGQCSCFGMEEIVSIAVLQDLDYVIVATSQGKIGIITSPPSLLRYNKVYEFINYDGEGLKIPVYPFHMVWSHEKKTLFIADDRSWVKAFDLSGKIEELYRHKEEEKNRKLAQENSAKYTLTLPEVSTSSPPIIWSIKAHNDPIKGFEYAENIGLIFTSALDKKIKIWHSDTGKYIDALQQKYDGVEPIPIAFKKPGWEGIFAPNLVERIDKEYTSKSRREQLQKQAELRSMYQRSPAASITSMEKSKLSPMKTLTSLKLDKVPSDSSPLGSPSKNQKEEEKGQDKKQINNSSFAVRPVDEEPGSPENALLSAYAEGEAGKTVDEIEEEEFNPYFNWKKIDLEKLGATSQSLQWKLHIDFTQNKQVFDKRVDEAAIKIARAEKTGVKGRLTVDQATTTPNEEFEPKEITSKEKQAIIEQEAEAVRKMKELEKKKEKNIEAILGNQLKEGHIMKGAIQYQNDNKYSQVKSKINNTLHNRELKGKSLDKHKKVISLTAEEAVAAKKLAEALSNYDKDDKRNVKFLEFQVKQQGKDKEHKDFINLNKQKLAASGTPSTNPNNSKDNTGR